MSSATISLTTTYQRLSTLMESAGFNINNLKREHLFIKNISATETVSVAFGSDTAAAASAGTAIGSLDSIKARNVDIGRAWIKTSSASDVTVSDEDIEYRSSSKPYSGIADNGTTVTVSERAAFSKSVAETPVALTSSATIALDCATGNVFTYTSGHTTTINASNQSAGQLVELHIRSDGTSRTQTFGTGFNSTGTLATGTDAALGFIITFRSNGTKLVERFRTTAIAFG